MKFKMFRDMVNSYQAVADDCGENIDDLEVVVYLDEDEREFNEDKNDYEPLEPFLRKKIYEVIKTYKNIRL